MIKKCYRKMVKELDNSWWAVFVLFVINPMTFVTAGYHFCATGPIVPVLRFMYNTTYTERHGQSLPEDTWLVFFSLTMSIFIAGALVGGTSIKILLSLMSGKRLMQVCHVTYILGILVLSVAGGMTWSYETMIIGRFVIGLPIGMYYALIPTMTSELSSRKTAAEWQSYGGIALPVGCLLGVFFAHPKVLGNIALWPVLYAISSIPSIMYLISSHWIPESPFYLIRKSKTEEAMQALQKLRQGSSAECKAELYAIETEVNKSTKIVGTRKLFTTKQYRNQALTVIAVFAGLQFTGATNFIIYTDQVFLQANISAENVTFCTIGVVALEVIAGIFGSRLVKRFGATRVSIGATIFIIFSLALFTISQATFHLAPTVMPYIAIVSVAVFLVAFFGGTQLTALVLAGDLTIEPTRPTVLAFATFVMWILSWFIGFIPPYLQVALGAYSMTIWLGCSILYLIFQLVYLPETKGKSIDEIQTHFK